MSESASHCVTSRCRQCDGHIEFNANQLSEGETRTLTCPHCGVENTICLPEKSTPLVQSALPSRVHESPEGVKWVRKGAAVGDVESMSNLGVAYMEGIGVEKNYPEAVKWLRRAAEKGNVTAQGNLGVCYYLGHGVEKNFIEAEKLIRQAAEKGNSFAQYHLGNLYHLGHGVPQDPLKAFDWWLKAAERGHIEAQNNVGFLYDDGAIAGQDFVEAYKWMSLAAAQGYAGAEEHSNQIAAKMTAEQLAESTRRTEDFNSKPKTEEQSGDYGLIGRLAEMGDVEAQAIVLANKDPEAAAELWMQAMKLKNGELGYNRRAIPAEVRREVWRRDQGRWVKCGSRENLEYDHIIPVSKGGSNTTRNIELLCENCNRAKSASIQ